METNKNMIALNEVFGPTIQGEGPYMGQRCYFIRLQGCDFRCSWCDTKQAQSERNYTSRITILGVIEKLVIDLNAKVNDVIVITGGNPEIQDNLYLLIENLVEFGFNVQIETQGSKFNEMVDRNSCTTVVSPKLKGALPNGYSIEGLMKYDHENTYLKFVISNEEDYKEMVSILKEFEPTDPNDIYECKINKKVFIQPVTPFDADLNVLGERYKEVIEMVANDIENNTYWDLTVFPQQHVIAYGTKSGV